MGHYDSSRDGCKECGGVLGHTRMCSQFGGYRQEPPLVESFNLSQLKKPPPEDSSTVGKEATAEPNSSKRPPFWLEGGFGVCVYVRLPNNSEPCFLTACHPATAHDIDQAIRFLQTLKGSL